MKRKRGCDGNFWKSVLDENFHLTNYIFFEISRDMEIAA